MSKSKCQIDKSVAPPFIGGGTGVGNKCRRCAMFGIEVFIAVLICSGSLSLAQTSKGLKEMGMKEIREPAVAGSWYSDNPEILSRELKGYLDNAIKGEIHGKIIALVSPSCRLPVFRTGGCPCL